MEWIIDFLNQLTNTNFYVAVLISFLAGLLTGFDPCWFGIASSVLAFQNKPNKNREYFLPLLTIMIGFITSFTILGLISIFLGEHLITRFKEFESIFNYILAIIFISMGIYLLDIFPYHVFITKGPIRIKQKKDKQKHLCRSIPKLFSLGALFAFTAIPCTAPMFLAIISYFIIKQSILESFLLFFIFGIGHSLPFLIIGLLFGVIERKAWIAHYHSLVNRLFGLMLMLFGIYFIFE